MKKCVETSVLFFRLWWISWTVFFPISHILRRVLVPQLCNSLGNFLNKCERKERVGCAISWTNHGGAFPRKMSNHSSFLHKTSHQKVPLSKSATINDPKDDSYKVLSNKSILTVVTGIGQLNINSDSHLHNKKYNWKFESLTEKNCGWLNAKQYLTYFLVSLIK